MRLIVTGTQKTLGLMELAAAVEAGKYGTDDEVDLDEVEDDLETLMLQA